MDSFSERQGMRPKKREIQLGPMDRDLRTGLWNALKLYYWDRFRRSYSYQDRTHQTSLAFTRKPII